MLASLAYTQQGSLRYIASVLAAAILTSMLPGRAALTSMLALGASMLAVGASVPRCPTGRAAGGWRSWGRRCCGG